MASEFGIRTTDNLYSVMIEHLIKGHEAKTLCNECMLEHNAKPNFLERMTITNVPHATSCDECGAITKEDFAKRYS